MSGYDVNLATLAAVVGALRATADKAGEAINVMNDLGGGDLGPGGLNEKVRDVAYEWGESVQEMREQIGESASSVRASGAVYRTLEEQARVAFKTGFAEPPAKGHS